MISTALRQPARLLSWCWRAVTATPTRRWTAGGAVVGFLLALFVPPLGVATAGWGMSTAGWLPLAAAALGALIGNRVGIGRERAR